VLFRSATPAQIEACAQLLPSATCADLLARNLPDVCHAKAGSLADGTPCGDDGQCVGARCKIAKNATCGVCGTHAIASAACSVDDDCAPGLSCINLTCTKLGVAGDACDMSRPCRADLGCTNSICGAPKTVGQACTTAPDNCDNLNAVICNGKTNVCAQATFAAVGAACGLVGNSLVACAGAGATCKGAVSPNFQGMCIAGAADGAACDDANGPRCLPPSVCSAGTCVLPNPATCK
jgi:hypothetical protein